MMKGLKTILGIVGCILYAAVFVCLFELSWRTAYVWSYLDEKAPVGRIVSGDRKMILIALAAGLLLAVVTWLLAARVRAYWTVRIGKRTLRISAFAVMILLDLLVVGYLGFEAYNQDRRYHEDRDKIDNIRTMLAEERRIYHAGGGIVGPDGQVYNYTNSKEAFLQSLDYGVKFVELDFRFTTDGEMVCIHKWNEDFVKAGEAPAGEMSAESAPEEAAQDAEMPVDEIPGETAPGEAAQDAEMPAVEASGDDAPEDDEQEDGAVSLEEFLQGKIRGFFTPMTVEDVAAAMREHPDLHIVVDLKGDDVVRGYRMLARRYPDLIDRLIPQFYHATQFDYLYGLGYRAMIFTLYRTGEWELSESALNSFAMRQMLVGITMGTYRVGDGSFVRQVLSTRQPVYIHTVDDPLWAQGLFDLGVSAVYTNVLP